MVVAAVAGIESVKGLSIVFEDIKYGTKKEALLTDETTTIDGVIAGRHNVKITGKLTSSNGDIYLMSIKGTGSNNYFFSKDNESLDLEVGGLRENFLMFKEIFFAGSKTVTGANYFRDQFYEIYNNSPDETVYLDGIFFANLTPTTASIT